MHRFPILILSIALRNVNCDSMNRNRLAGTSYFYDLSQLRKLSLNCNEQSQAIGICVGLTNKQKLTSAQLLRDVRSHVYYCYFCPTLSVLSANRTYSPCNGKSSIRDAMQWAWALHTTFVLCCLLLYMFVQISGNETKLSKSDSLHIKCDSHERESTSQSTTANLI